MAAGAVGDGWGVLLKPCSSGQLPWGLHPAGDPPAQCQLSWEPFLPSVTIRLQVAKLTPKTSILEAAAPGAGLEAGPPPAPPQRPYKMAAPRGRRLLRGRLGARRPPPSPRR